MNKEKTNCLLDLFSVTINNACVKYNTSINISFIPVLFTSM